GAGLGDRSLRDPQAVGTQRGAAVDIDAATIDAEGDRARGRERGRGTQRAGVDTDLAGGIAKRAVHADGKRAAEDERAAEIAVVAGQSQCRRSYLVERARARNHAGPDGVGL